MMRVLVGQDLKDFKDQSSALRRAEALLKVSEEKRASAEHGWVTTAAHLRDVQELADRLARELEDTMTALEVALKGCADREQALAVQS